LTGGRCSEVTLGLKVVGWDLEWSLLTGGRCSEVVVSTGLTVLIRGFDYSMTKKQEKNLTRELI